MYKFSLRSNVLAVLKVHCQSNSIFSGNSETKTFENISLKNNTSVTEISKTDPCDISNQQIVVN